MKRYHFSCIFIFLLGFIFFLLPLFAQSPSNTTDNDASQPANADNNPNQEEADSSLDEEDIQEEVESSLDEEDIQEDYLLFKKKKLVDFMDISLALNVMFAPISHQSFASFIKESYPFAISIDPSYKKINESSTIPFGFGFDLRFFYKFIGSGLSYQRINAVHAKNTVGKATTATDNDFNGFTNIHSYLIKASGDAVTLEFFFRKFIASEELYLLFGFGYMYQKLKIDYSYEAETALRRNNLSKSEKAISHGGLIRLEINYGRGYFIYSFGMALLFQDFPDISIQDPSNVASLNDLPLNFNTILPMFYLRIGSTF